MCGILGYIGKQRASNVLLDGLKKLEYRGYDSAGLAVMDGGQIELRRSVGKLSELERLIQQKHIHGRIGLGHTRWATHGAPSEINAHPHTDASQRIIVVHNGIIENYLSLKERLQKKGFVFASETDTEVVAHLIGSYFHPLIKKNPKNPKKMFVEAIQKALKDIKGTYALGIICTSIPDLIIGARRDCPLIVGVGKKENFLASDVPAVLSHTREVIFLEEGDLAILDENKVVILDEKGKPAKRPQTKILWDPIQAEKSGYKHFMLKEIHEQSRIVEDTLLGRLNLNTGMVRLNEAKLTDQQAKELSRIHLIACGTSWHACLIGAFLIEKYTGIPCQVDIASEFRYRDPLLEKKSLVIAVSQSGETADTLAAVRLAKKKGIRVLSIANVVGSTLTRDADGSILTHCGPEIGVASTKAFMGQLVAFHMITLNLARLRKSLSYKQLKMMGQNLAHLSQWITQTLKCESEVEKIAKKYHKRGHFLFLGRNLNYPIALEGALKLKEISYIHAEGYPAGEMKHGPIALIDGQMPVVAITTHSAVYEKMLSNIEEARSRGADVIAVASKGDKAASAKAAHVIYVPVVPEELTPLINVIPLQILAYQIAVLRGCDVDQPRNLAKSVTVE
ncbi:glutamine--fructose-6-phosphate transaminase (isomerizing) [bacterium F11]|nr:glutamine--fructose-6-phosphate transaminase (isomerizing) [bacterium F11]